MWMEAGWWWVCVVIGILSWWVACRWKSSIVWGESGRVRRKLRMQGITGPPPSFLYGNLPLMQKLQSQAKPPSLSSHHSHLFVSHDYTSYLFPYFEHWRRLYGNPSCLPSIYLLCMCSFLLLHNHHTTFPLFPFGSTFAPSSYFYALIVLFSWRQIWGGTEKKHAFDLDHDFFFWVRILTMIKDVHSQLVMHMRFNSIF